MEAMAWLWLVLREIEDNPKTFPHGKWATLQSMEAQLTVAAKASAAELEARVLEVGELQVTTATPTTLSEFEAAAQASRAHQPRDFIETFSGRYVSYKNFTVDDVDVKDIAYGLSRLPRYVGQYRHNGPGTTVLTHSLWTAAYVLTFLRDLPELRGMVYRTALLALLHDAAEAYLSDVPTPLKRLLPEYQKIEARFQATIEARYFNYEFPGACRQAAKIADAAAFLAERAALFNAGRAEWLPRFDWNWRPTISALSAPVDVAAAAARDHRPENVDIARFMLALDSLRSRANAEARATIVRQFTPTSPIENPSVH